MAERRVPRIRFKGFEEDWEQRKLEEFASETRGGGTPATSNETYWNGDIPWIQSSDLKENELFEVKPRKYVSKIGLRQSATQLVEANSIAIVTRVGVGKLALMPHSYTTSQDFLSLSQLQVEPYFAVYSIYHLLQEELEVVQGTSIKGLTKEDLLSKSLLIPVDMGEQTQLGGLFYKLDSLISLHQRKLEKLKILKKAMLEKLFPKNGAKVPEIRFSGFTDDWEQRKLDEMASFSKGIGYSKADLRESGTPVILYGRLYTRYETSISVVDTFVGAKQGTVSSRGGEVIVPASGETAEEISIASVVGKPGILLGGDLNIIIPSKDLNSAFLAISISHARPHDKLTKMAQGKSVVHLHNTDLRQVEIDLPSYEEQQGISNLFETLDSLLSLHQRKLEKLRQIKKSMLERMFV